MNMKTITSLCNIAGLFLLMVFPLAAQIIYQGPNNGVIFQNVAISNSSTVWTSVQNAQYPDGILTTAGPLSSSGSFSDYLMATQFYFTISAEYTISGIEVVLARNSTRLPQTYDYRVRIVKNGIISSYDHSNITPWQAQSNPATYGSNGDLWGETWTTADINSSGFGVAVAVKKQGAGQDLTVFIDNIQVRVYYYDASGNTYYSGTSGASLRTVSLSGTITSEQQIPIFSVFPNPSDGSFLSVRFGKSPQQDMLMVLTDVTGREFYSKVITSSDEKLLEIIHTSNPLPSGIYLITASSNDNFYMKKVIVQK